MTIRKSLIKLPWHQRFQRKIKPKDHSGLYFSSKLEEAVYQVLCLREKAGEIYDIKCQQTIILIDGPEPIKHRIDFTFKLAQNDELTGAEAKGFSDPVWELKRKLYVNGHSPITIEIWKGDYRKPRLIEVIRKRGFTEEEK